MGLFDRLTNTKPDSEQMKAIRAEAAKRGWSQASFQKLTYCQQTKTWDEAWSNGNFTLYIAWSPKGIVRVAELCSGDDDQKVGSVNNAKMVVKVFKDKSRVFGA